MIVTLNSKEFYVAECCNCGVTFMYPQILERQFKMYKTTFYCPNGHGQAYTKSTSDTLKENLEVKNKLLNEKDRQISQLESQINKLAKKPKKK